MYSKCSKNYYLRESKKALGQLVSAFIKETKQIM